MAAQRTGEKLEMEGFVRGLFQGRPDLNVLTHTIIREKYRKHVGKESLTKEEREQLKKLVEEELVQMKVDDSPGSDEVSASVKSGGHKRSRCTSNSSETSSDEEDSGIDSKKIPLCDGSRHAGKSSSSSGQEESGAESHTDGSESDGIAKSKGRHQPQRAKNEKLKGSKRSNGLCGRRQRDRSESESEETTEEQQSDMEEGGGVGEQTKSAKGLITESENDSEQEFQGQKGFNKQQKQTVAKRENRKVDDQRGKKKNESEEDSEPSKVGKIHRKKKTDWSESEEEKKSASHNKGEDKARQRAWKSQERTKSEDDLESESEERPRNQKKMAKSKERIKGMSVEKLDSDSDRSEGKSQMKVATQKGKTRKASEDKWSPESESDSEDKRHSKKGGLKRTQKRNVSSKKLMEEKEGKKQGIHEPRRSVSSEDTESESDKCKDLKQSKKGMRKPSISESESQSEAEEREKDKGKCQKITLSSVKWESGPEECESRIQGKKMALKKKSNSMSGSESSQEEEKQGKRRAEKSQRANNTESESESDDSESDLARRKKSQGQQKKETQKPKKRQKSKEEPEIRLVEKEESSSSGDEDNPTSSKQRHQGKGKDHHSGKSEEHHSIRRLKRYIWECGVRRNYKKLFEGCRSRKGQVEILKRELEDLGMKGPPSLAKCKALKQKREEAAEVASLDLSNIISTKGRPRRRNVWSLYSKPEEPPSSPEEPPIHRPATDWSHLRGVISSDGESS
ncbi:hypothetical protein JD844_001363 [Phrynosoma platyrhinos]|uniref:Histone chaperone domain-containing protein n=1 Tax=Phrynosoma platyrhinos TaxID=52577 RepID=A0ABQ7TAB7_PHRPL|nr:hypothetical protein JD844_001363 [Phrynosoma platyrhinos]